jgi:anti-sigma factor RsiW
VVTAFSGGQTLQDHREAQELLPWYVTGKLDADEHARVDAHLAGCAECQADVKFQQRLEAEVARLPVDVEAGWARMRLQVEAERMSPVRRIARLAEGRAAWAGWGIAASLALVVGATVAPPMVLSQADQAGYHALGARAAAPAGNVVVIFRPDVSEAAMRATLRAAHARLVDGPTAADAWVLSVPAAERNAALTTLKGRREVVLAEPVDAGSVRP